MSDDVKFSYAYGPRTYHATYSVHDGGRLLTVESDYGRETAECGYAKPLSIAKITFDNILRKAKERGDIR
jgi:hypothetical protein